MPTGSYVPVYFGKFLDDSCPWWARWSYSIPCVHDGQGGCLLVPTRYSLHVIICTLNTANWCFVKWSHSGQGTAREPQCYRIWTNAAQRVERTPQSRSRGAVLTSKPRGSALSPDHLAFSLCFFSIFSFLSEVWPQNSDALFQVRIHPACHTPGAADVRCFIQSWSILWQSVWITHTVWSGDLLITWSPLSISWTCCYILFRVITGWNETRKASRKIYLFT